VIGPPSIPSAFVSHSRQDREFVEKFAKDLWAVGIKAWYSPWEIKPGDPIRKKIEEGLEACDFFIVVISAGSISRPWLQAELDIAADRKLQGKIKKIIPVKIEHCDHLPPILESDLAGLVTELRSEGLDARADLFNGQVGLIIGPKGLDPSRLPPETAGLFFPLWELNFTPNRPFVQARKFHEIFESRPNDWRFNQPYQRSADQVRLGLRHWNRSAALFGRDQQQRLQSDLIRHFPPSDFPINIDVIGGQDQTFATVHITNTEAGIEEAAKAIPEDFVGAGGMRAAVLAVIQGIVSKLQQDGRLRANVRQENVENAAPLSLRATGRAGHGPDASKWDQIFQYEVIGLPTNEQAWIANFGGPYHHEWRILRSSKGVQADWNGNYVSAEAALLALKKDLDTRMEHIEMLKGVGTVTSGNGERVAVTYELHIYEERIPVGTMDDPHATMPGLKEIRGRIEPVCFFGENALVLELQDKRKLLFFFKDEQGSIALNRWIG